MPKRIQLSRKKGWRKPQGAISVARPSRWGNPFRVADCIEAGFASDEKQARVVVVHAFTDWLRGDRWADGSGPVADERRRTYLASIPQLAGSDLACWCPLDQPCHADVLLDLANQPEFPASIHRAHTRRPDTGRGMSAPPREPDKHTAPPPRTRLDGDGANDRRRQ